MLDNAIPNSTATSLSRKNYFANENAKKNLQSHFITTQHFPEGSSIFYLLRCSPFTLAIALLSSIEERRHEKTINYKNQLPFQLNQITDCKNVGFESIVLFGWTSIFKKKLKNLCSVWLQWIPQKLNQKISMRSL